MLARLGELAWLLVQLWERFNSAFVTATCSTTTQQDANLQFFLMPVGPGGGIE